MARDALAMAGGRLPSWQTTVAGLRVALPPMRDMAGTSRRVAW